MGPNFQFLLSSRRILLASDFDGTLAPIVPDPSAARALPEAAAQLARIAAHPAVELAIVSGRSLQEMDRLCDGLPRSWKIGDHGRSAKGPDGNPVDGWPEPEASGSLEDLELEARALAALHPGMAVERKRHGVCLHLRNVAPGSRNLALEQAHAWKTRWASRGLESMEGREVVEVQTRGGGKLAAIRRLRELTDSDFVVFAGDDTTDIPSLEWLSGAPDGFGVWVRSPEREPPGFEPDSVVEGPGGWAALLERIASQLEKRI